MMLTPNIYLTVQSVTVTRRKQSCQGGSKSTKLDLNVKHTLCLRMYTQQPDRGAQNYRKHFILLKEGKSKEHRLGGTNRKHTATWCLHTEYQHYKQSQYSN